MSSQVDAYVAVSSFWLIKLPSLMQEDKRQVTSLYVYTQQALHIIIRNNKVVLDLIINCLAVCLWQKYKFYSLNDLLFSVFCEFQSVITMNIQNRANEGDQSHRRVSIRMIMLCYSGNKNHITCYIPQNLNTIKMAREQNEKRRADGRKAIALCFKWSIFYLLLFWPKATIHWRTIHL